MIADKIKQYFQHILTDADNSTYSSGKLIALSSSLAMSAEFLYTHSQDYQGFGIAQAALVAAVAAKHYVDTKNDSATNTAA